MKGRTNNDSLKNTFFPKIKAKINGLVKQCKICIESKYDRHPIKSILRVTPLPQYPGQIVHIYVYITNKRTEIDNFSKLAQA